LVDCNLGFSKKIKTAKQISNYNRSDKVKKQR
jgi:hypothetical protein